MKKNILLVAATQNEIAPYLQTNPHHDVLITGVGMPSSIFRLTRQIVHNHYDLVVQAGIGGAFAHSFAKAGHVVQVTEDAFGDLGALENGHFNDLQQLQLNYDPVWLPAKGYETGLPHVKGISVQTITDHVDIVRTLSDKWKADVESMEGAAAAYVCLQKQVPFVQIRAISNMVGDRNKAHWEIDLAIQNLNQALITLMQQQFA